jgi:hypothetical protein
VTLAFTPDAWTQVIVAVSIFGPVVVALAITIAVLRGKKNDPDEQRMRRAQRDYEASRKD